MSSVVGAVENTLVSPDGDLLYEVVNGQRVELPPMGAKEISVASVLHFYLCLHLYRHNTGWAFAEMLFRLRGIPKLERRPDLAFVPYDRWPQRIVPDLDAWEMIPALAVEVVSKNNTAEEIEEKITDYFENGVALVWVIYPRQLKIYIYESLKSIRVLDIGDTLDGGSVLPEFRLPVAKLFGELQPAQ